MQLISSYALFPYFVFLWRHFLTKNSFFNTPSLLFYLARRCSCFDRVFSGVFRSSVFSVLFCFLFVSQFVFISLSCLTYFTLIISSLTFFFSLFLYLFCFFVKFFGFYYTESHPFCVSSISEHSVEYRIRIWWFQTLTIVWFIKCNILFIKPRYLNPFEIITA